MTDAPNDIDTFMERINDINHKSADELSSDDITVLIAYHRRNRARLAAGQKPVRPKIDLSEILGSNFSKPASTGPNPFRGKL